MKTYCVPDSELRRIRDSERALCNPYLFARIVSNIVKFNALSLSARSNGGNVCLCDSAADIGAWLYTQVLKNPNESFFDEICDKFFYSGFYYNFLFRSIESFFGTEENRAASIGSILAATLKAKELGVQVKASGVVGRVYAIVEYDRLCGEVFWEEIKQMAEENMSGVTFIVDNNQRQFDNIAWRFHESGWGAAECNGHNFQAIDNALRDLRNINPKKKPQVLVIYTKKSAFKNYQESADEILRKLNLLTFSAGLGSVSTNVCNV